MGLTGAQHLYGDMMEIKATVRETITVAPGNIMVLNSVSKLISKGNLSGASTADNYAYPIGCTPDHGTGEPVWRQRTNARILGISMNDSAKATTTIAIATAGVFRFPLQRTSAVTLGSLMSSVTMHSTFSVNSSTTVSYLVFNKLNAGVTLGRCVRTQSGASTVDIMIRTMPGPGGVIT